MKKIITFLVAAVLTASMFAQAPRKMSYQAVIRNSEDALVTNTQIGLKISILQGSESGTAVYTTTKKPSTNANGLISVEFGDPMDFDYIDWNQNSYFLKTEIDPTGGTAYSITGVSQLLSVPYALHASTAQSLTRAITETDPVYTESQAANITSTDITNLSNLSGTNTGDQSLESVLSKNTSAGNKKISNLSNPSNAQDAATKAYVDALEQQIEEMQNSMMTAGSIARDYDGNIYGVVSIGTQKWMAENLKTTHFSNGDEIPDGTGAGDISGLYNPLFWFAARDELNKVSTYGRLYTWHVVADSRNVCPDGWHVPTDDEWATLIDYLGGKEIAGGKLKETGTTYWSSPNYGATNETGFTALPGGFRTLDGDYANINTNGNWWSVTEKDAAEAWYLAMYYSHDYASRFSKNKSRGHSIRCLRD